MASVDSPAITDDETATFPAAPVPMRISLNQRLASARSVIVRDIAEFHEYQGVIVNLVAQELQVRYQRSMLGFLWTLVNPALMMGTQALVFSRLFRGIGGMGPWEYAIFLFAGAMPWTFLASSITDSTTSLIQQEGLIRKIYVPKWIFPLARVLIQSITFTLSLIALFIMMWPLGARVSSSLLALPLAILLIGIFTMGMGLIAALLRTVSPRFAGPNPHVRAAGESEFWGNALGPNARHKARCTNTPASGRHRWPCVGDRR